MDVSYWMLRQRTFTCPSASAAGYSACQSAYETSKTQIRHSASSLNNLAQTVFGSSTTKADATASHIP